MSTALRRNLAWPVARPSLVRPSLLLNRLLISSIRNFSPGNNSSLFHLFLLLNSYSYSYSSSSKDSGSGNLTRSPCSHSLSHSLSHSFSLRHTHSGSSSTHTLLRAHRLPFRSISRISSRNRHQWASPPSRRAHSE